MRMWNININGVMLVEERNERENRGFHARLAADTKHNVHTYSHTHTHWLFFVPPSLTESQMPGRVQQICQKAPFYTRLLRVIRNIYVKLEHHKILLRSFSSVSICPYLYFCTIKASKLRTSSRSHDSDASIERRSEDSWRVPTLMYLGNTVML